MTKSIIIAIALFVSTVTWAQNKQQAPQPVAAATEAHPEGGINWVSVNDLPALQAKQPRKVLIDVYTPWCGPCKMMMNSTFKDPAIVKYVNENFYAVKFNAEGNEVVNFKGYVFKNDKYDPARATSRNSTHDFTMAVAPVKTQIAYPTIVYFDENLNILAPIQGYLQPAQFQPILTYFKENKYKEIDINTYMQQAGQ